MMIYLDRICRENNIDYWLSSGTLLGAVRHGGFIPWDDDLDIEMMRNDYEKLLGILAKQDRYDLQTHKTDPYYRLPFAKLRDKHSFVEEYGRDAKYRFRGIFIDIFCLEYTHDFPSRLAARLLRFISFYAVKGHSKMRRLLFMSMKKAIFTLIPTLRLLGALVPGRRLRHTIGTPFRTERYEKDIFPLKDIEFEGHLFRCPADHDAYLRRLFGDYHTLPPVEQRIPHSVKVVFHD